MDCRKNLWYDFGFGEGGTMVAPVMKLYRCSFREATRILEGSEMPAPVLPKPPTVNAGKSVLLDVLPLENNEHKKSNQKKVVEAAPVHERSSPSPLSQMPEIKVTDIVPNPANPRRYSDDESLSELARNILQHGVLQPVTVREIPEEGGKRYELIFGERRFRAAKIAGLETIPCMIRLLNGDAAFDLMVSENLQRRDIRPSEEAAAFKSILERGNSIAQISERFGKSETFIHSRPGLVRLIPEIRELLDREEISIGIAVEISRLEPEIQTALFKDRLDTFVNWKSLPLKVFRERLETAYTVLLSRFPFDKSECERCPFNSELHSIFPVLENSRCTRHSCLTGKQEKYMLDAILSAVGENNADVYINSGSSSAIHSEAVKKLRGPGIEVKTGNSYRMPENPVMPAMEDYRDDPEGYDRAQKDFHIKQSKWNALQKLLEDGLAQKIILIDNFEPVPGYIMVVREKETVKPHSENRTVSGTSDKTADTSGSAENPQNPQSPQSTRDGQNIPAVTGANSATADKPDLMAVLQEKDRKNKEEALMKVIEEARTFIKDTDIPPVEITPFEESLMYYVMLSFLDHRHYELFGIPEGQTLTEEVALGLYTALTGEQKNVLRRDFLIRHLLSRNRIKKSDHARSRTIFKKLAYWTSLRPVSR